MQNAYKIRYAPFVSITILQEILISWNRLMGFHCLYWNKSILQWKSQIQILLVFSGRDYLMYSYFTSLWTSYQKQITFNARYFFLNFKSFVFIQSIQSEESTYFHNSFWYFDRWYSYFQSIKCNSLVLFNHLAFFVSFHIES